MKKLIVILSLFSCILINLFGQNDDNVKTIQHEVQFKTAKVDIYNKKETEITEKALHELNTTYNLDVANRTKLYETIDKLSKALTVEKSLSEELKISLLSYFKNYGNHIKMIWIINLVMWIISLILVINSIKGAWVLVTTSLILLLYNLITLKGALLFTKSSFHDILLQEYIMRLSG